MKKTIKSLTVILMTAFFLISSITFLSSYNFYLPKSIAVINYSNHNNKFSAKTDNALKVNASVKKVVPCGQPFGIKMLTEGIMVVRLSDINGKNNSCPAEEAGIKVGDIIISIDE